MKIVQPAVPHHELRVAADELPKNAVNQIKLLQYIHAAQEESFEAGDLAARAEVPRQTIAALVKKGILSETEEDVYRDPYKHKTFQRTTPLPLTAQQQEAIRPILETIETNIHQTFMLFGVTGSGKTEVYLQSIHEVIKKGEEAIVLVPEIALTPQMVERFKGRFGSDVAVLHSRLSIGEQYDEWRKIQKRKSKSLSERVQPCLPLSKTWESLL